MFGGSPEYRFEAEAIFLRGETRGVMIRAVEMFLC